MAKKRRNVSFLRICEGEARKSNRNYVNVVVRKGKSEEKIISVLRRGILEHVWDAHESPIVYYSRIIDMGIDRSIVYCPFEGEAGKEVHVSTKYIPSYLPSIIDGKEISKEEYDEWKKTWNDDENHVGVWIEQKEKLISSNGKETYSESYIELRHGLVSYIQNIFGDIADLDKITGVLALPMKVIVENPSHTYYKPMICVCDDRDVIKILKLRERGANMMSPMQEVSMHQQMFERNKKCPVLKSVSEIVGHGVTSIIIKMEHIGETLHARATRRDDDFLKDLSNGKFSEKLKELFETLIETRLTHNDMHLDNIYENKKQEYCLLDFANARHELDPGDYTYDWMQLRIGAQLFDDDAVHMSMYISAMDTVMSFLLQEWKERRAIIDKKYLDRGNFNVKAYFQKVVSPRLLLAYNNDDKKRQIREDFERVKEMLDENTKKVDRM